MRTSAVLMVVMTLVGMTATAHAERKLAPLKRREVAIAAGAAVLYLGAREATSAWAPTSCR